jgi:hypothetical protein
MKLLTNLEEELILERSVISRFRKALFSIKDKNIQAYNIKFPVLCLCKTWSPALREEYVFENEVISLIYVPNKNKVS